MQGDIGYGPPSSRRGSGSWLTHAIVAVLGAGIAIVVVLLFFTPASGGSLPGSGAVPAPAPSSAPLASGQAQQQQDQQNGGSGDSGSTPGCYTSNADLTVPTAIAPVSSGTLIDGTICGSPAASVGMTGGAVITAVNGQAVGSPDDLASILARFHPGDTISVTWVSPAGQRTTSSLHLTAGPPQ